MDNIELEEGVFFNTVLRDPKGLISSFESEKDELEDGHELIIAEEEYDYEELL